MSRRKAPSCTAGTAAIGTVCPGGAIFAGVFDGRTYMITPGGCSYDPSGNSTSAPSSDFTPTCSGTDGVAKTWNDGTSNWYDVPGVEMFSTYSQKSSSDYRGDVNTAAIVSITAPAQGGLHAAAHYCDKLNFGGYTDWVLPSKSELAYMYCKSRTSGNGSYPQEDPNCATYGYGVGANLLSGFRVDGSYYRVSTEFTFGDAWLQRLSDGYQNYHTKATVYYVRCIRTIGSDLIGSLPTPEDFTPNLTVTNLDVNYTANPESSAQTIIIKNQGDLNAGGVTMNITSGFAIVGGTCSPVIPLNQGQTCTIDIKGTSAGRVFDGAFAGQLTLSDSGSSRIINLQGTSSNMPDPCLASPTIGTQCASGAVYAGTFDGGTYMTTPGGCAFEPGGNTNTYSTTDFTPACSGTDSMKKYWSDGGGDIPGVETVALDSQASSPSYRGDVNTAAIVVITAPGDGGYHAAARYCDKLSYAGYTDWYLPSKSELAYLYCKSRTTTGNASYPQEDPNCSSIGYASGSNVIPGITTADYYWSSTEGSIAGVGAYVLNFSSGFQLNHNKSVAPYYVRCVRRF